VLTGLAILLLVVFFRKTSLGLAMRAVAANEQAARVVGLNVAGSRPRASPWLGPWGAWLGSRHPITTLAYDVGVLLGLKGFAAAILGASAPSRGPLWGDHAGPARNPVRGICEQRLQGRNGLCGAAAGAVYKAQGLLGNNINYKDIKEK